MEFLIGNRHWRDEKELCRKNKTQKEPVAGPKKTWGRTCSSLVWSNRLQKPKHFHFTLSPIPSGSAHLLLHAHLIHFYAAPMGSTSTSTISFCSHPKIFLRLHSLGPRGLGFAVSSLGYHANGALVPVTHRRRGFRLRNLALKATLRSDGGSRRAATSRRVYRESQTESSSLIAPVKQLASTVLPAGVFVVVTFVLWKLVERLMVPKSDKSPSSVKKNWSFGAGINLFPDLTAKIDREAKLKLNDFAKELRTFRSVDMTGRNFGDEGLFFLAESLGYNQTVEEANFSANGITAEGIKAFDGVLQSNIVLKTLDLSGNPIGDDGVKTLCDLLVNNSSIQTLRLNSTDVGDEGAKAVAEMLKKNSSLRVLELNNNMIDYSGFTSLGGALLENNTIRNIHLSGNYGGALGANALAKGLEGNKSLRELHLNGNSIGDEGVRALISGLSSRKGKLALLDIGNNSITAKGVFHVAEFIKRTKSLVLLNLYMNDIGDEGAEKIADALKQNRTIKTLDLGGNNIHGEGISKLAEALKDNDAITTLEIAYNPIGPEGAKALSEVLKFHGNVKNLKLGWCKIGPKGAELIAETLKYNTTISVLDLRGNGLRDEGATCLARSLKVVNEALTSLDLGFNEIRDPGAFAIAQALKANEDIAVTSLNLANNFLTKFGQSALTDARDHVHEMCEKEGMFRAQLKQRLHNHKSFLFSFTYIITGSAVEANMAAHGDCWQVVCL
ncbi:unnamed protein product [Citrullus colocynthis]|uniref:Protein NLRC3 n=1 Tax=Citrullus colocynthis TaxID=252529 RepID=A0ABP0XKB6_9ROSI